MLAFVAGCSSASKLKTLPELPYEKRHIIAVLDFENKTGNEEYDIVLNGLSDLVIEELLKYGRFRIVERERLNDILSEFKLEMTGFIDDKYVKEIGKHLGVDALFLGSLKSVTHKENKNFAGLAYTLKRKTEVVLSAHLVSVETNEIISSSTVVSDVTQKRAWPWLCEVR